MYLSVLCDVDIEASACVLFSLCYAMLCLMTRIVLLMEGSAYCHIPFLPLTVIAIQGSDTRVHTQKTRWVFWVDPPKKPANKTRQ